MSVVTVARNAPVSVAPAPIDRVLAAFAGVLLIAIVTALSRGHAQWAHVSIVIWVHIMTILVALALTPVMLLRQRGNAAHRTLGTIWVVAMLATAALSLFIHVAGPGRFSVIHLLSVFTLVQVPLLWRAARRHDVRRHRRGVYGIVIGALLVAGFFTFSPKRLLGSWLMVSTSADLNKGASDHRAATA
jgi:uncharacterized membrane protein